MAGWRWVCVSAFRAYSTCYERYSSPDIDLDRFDFLDRPLPLHVDLQSTTVTGRNNEWCKLRSQYATRCQVFIFLSS
jgi:hypothetical protein